MFIFLKQNSNNHSSFHIKVKIWLVNYNLSYLRRIFDKFSRFQNRRMKWRNTKERDLFISSNSHDKHDCCDYQQKEEILTYRPERNHSHIDAE